MLPLGEKEIFSWIVSTMFSSALFLSWKLGVFSPLEALISTSPKDPPENLFVLPGWLEDSLLSLLEPLELPFELEL